MEKFFVFLVVCLLSCTIGANAGGFPGLLDVDRNNTDPDVLTLLGDPLDQFASTLAWGDVNGDGSQDLVIGAPNYSGPSGKLDYQVGRVVVLYGGSNSSFFELGDFTQLDPGICGSFFCLYILTRPSCIHPKGP